MAHASKIATCCYCGTRAALVLTGRERHELACSSCGAPLHDLKMLRSDHAGQAETRRPEAARPARMRRPERSKRERPSKKKRSRSLSAVFMRELIDKAEDIFDIFD